MLNHFMHTLKEELFKTHLEIKTHNTSLDNTLQTQ
jgi:hypothetical protein